MSIPTRYASELRGTRILAKRFDLGHSIDRAQIGYQLIRDVTQIGNAGSGAISIVFDTLRRSAFASYERAEDLTCPNQQFCVNFIGPKCFSQAVAHV